MSTSLKSHSEELTKLAAAVAALGGMITGDEGEVGSGPSHVDTQWRDRGRANGRVTRVQATNAEEVKAAVRDKRKRELAEGGGLPANKSVWVSAAKGIGIDRRRGLILHWLSDSDADH